MLTKPGRRLVLQSLAAHLNGTLFPRLSLTHAQDAQQDIYIVLLSIRTDTNVHMHTEPGSVGASMAPPRRLLLSRVRNPLRLLGSSCSASDAALRNTACAAPTLVRVTCKDNLAERPFREQNTTPGLLWGRFYSRKNRLDPSFCCK